MTNAGISSIRRIVSWFAAVRFIGPAGPRAPRASATAATASAPVTGPRQLEAAVLGGRHDAGSTASEAGGIAQMPGRDVRELAPRRPPAARPSSGFSCATSASTRLAARARSAAADDGVGLEGVVRIDLHDAGARDRQDPRRRPVAARVGDDDRRCAARVNSSGSSRTANSAASCARVTVGAVSMARYSGGIAANAARSRSASTALSSASSRLERQRGAERFGGLRQVALRFVESRRGARAPRLVAARAPLPSAHARAPRQVVLRAVRRPRARDTGTGSGATPRCARRYAPRASSSWPASAACARPRSSCCAAEPQHVDAAAQHWQRRIGRERSLEALQRLVSCPARAARRPGRRAPARSADWPPPRDRSAAARPCDSCARARRSRARLRPDRTSVTASARRRSSVRRREDRRPAATASLPCGARAPRRSESPRARRAR